MQIVITGANRGIGLELARQFIQRGDTVTALVREPDRAKELKQLGISVVRCDVSRDESVRAAAKQVPAAIDVLVNNAGMMGRSDGLEALKEEEALTVLGTNALSAVLVTRALLPQLRAGKRKAVMLVTSGLGSIEDNTSGGHYAYRMSKAALNMAGRTLAVDLRADGISVAVINPGWVQTDMGGRSAPTPVEESARGIIARIDELGPATSGLFLDFRGKTSAW